MKIEIYGELEIGLMITSPNVYLYFKIFTNTGQIVISMVLFDIFGEIFFSEKSFESFLLPYHLSFLTEIAPLKRFL